MNESATPAEVLAEWLTKKPGNAPIRHRLGPFEEAGIPALRLLLLAEGVPGAERQYHLVDSDKPLKESLSGKLLIEYPVVAVVLPSEASSYPIASEIAPPEWEEFSAQQQNRPPPPQEEPAGEQGLPIVLEEAAVSVPSPKRQKVTPEASGMEASGFEIVPDGSIIRT